MRSMDHLDNGIFDKKMTELIKEIRFYNHLSLLSLAWDMDLLRRADVQKLLAEMSGNRINLIKERYEEKEAFEKLEKEQMTK